MGEIFLCGTVHVFFGTVHSFCRDHACFLHITTGGTHPCPELLTLPVTSIVLSRLVVPEPIDRAEPIRPEPINCKPIKMEIITLSQSTLELARVIFYLEGELHTRV